MKSQSNPLRTCVGCGRKRSQNELLRVAAISEGAPVVDGCKRSVGRGAYLCRDLHCVERALSRRSLERSLKLRNSISPTTKLEILEAAARQLAPHKGRGNDGEN